MKRFIPWSLLIGGIIFVISPVFAQTQYKYIGVKRCMMCHKGEKKGKIYEIWKESKHSTAYTTLLTEQSKEVAKKAGVEGPPEKAEQCLKCHVTGFGVDQGAFMKSFNSEDGVTCEECHGPGSVYQKITIMRDNWPNIFNLSSNFMKNFNFFFFQGF